MNRECLFDHGAFLRDVIDSIVVLGAWTRLPFPVFFGQMDALNSENESLMYCSNMSASKSSCSVAPISSARA